MDVKVDLRVTFTKRELVSNLIHDIRIAYSVFSDIDSGSYYRSRFLYENCMASIGLYWRVGILTLREKMLLDSIVKGMFGE